MRARIILVICLCAVGVAVAAAPRAKKRINPLAAQGVAGPFLKSDNMPPLHPAMLAPDAPANPPWTVIVPGSLNLGSNAQNLANILSTVTKVPNARTVEYAAILNGNYIINQWFGTITQIADDGAGGNLVTLIIGADLANQDGSGAPRPLMMGYSEQWDVDVNGNPTFVQSFDPGNMAGQMPIMMVD